MEELEVIQAQRALQPHGPGEVAVDEAQVARPSAAEHAAREPRARGGAQLDRGVAVVDGLGTPRAGDVAGDGPDDVAHGGERGCRDVLLVGQRELVGDEDAVDPARLQSLKIAFGGISHLGDAPTRVVERIAGQRPQVQKADDRLLGTEELSEERHPFSFHDDPVGRDHPTGESVSGPGRPRAAPSRATRASGPSRDIYPPGYSPSTST